ncbi:hypothetical protein [Bradyrhizobium aeschynomenes]|uniref:hypothetical protein n=1 Tax=Bradyrhizobium aeschynomenes TaxID=2734909 RepID=UPI001557B291|nr:hypothetical protein [Bradyrhizobium aeschynomenes]NPV22047.1 hypothetical protein [Bradyrhizobium aeschynomenes]
MKKLLLIALVLGSSQAEAAPTYTYLCQDHGRKLPVKIDESKNTLTWKGTVYSIKVKEDCGRYGWRAEKDDVGFDFCTATQGAADFELNGVTYVCDMKR